MAGQFVEEQALICPLCHKALKQQANGSLQCVKKHCFDVSRRGYVNFAPGKGAQKYSKELFECRRAIFQDGFYDPVVKELGKILLQRAKKPRARILDAGCGDGYYARALSAQFPNRLDMYAFDLSRDAVDLAARGENKVKWMVADLTNIPVKNGGMDGVMDIFTPANYAEFSRVLIPGGLLLKVIPGEEYLIQLRKAAADQLRNASYSNERVTDYFEKHFALIDRKRITHTLPVNEEQKRHFARMTPMMFGVDTDALDLSAMQEMTIDVEILVGRRLPSAGKKPAENQKSASVGKKAR
ncbi:MAG: methyltransferase domain-containing protein [Clostridiales bacterium]|nr:methyltransferase domain-containing protein [Clostridiales bacterium]